MFKNFKNKLGAICNASNEVMAWLDLKFGLENVKGRAPAVYRELVHIQWPASSLFMGQILLKNKIEKIHLKIKEIKNKNLSHKDLNPLDFST